MPVYFADTSALAKRYISEAGSAWLRRLLDPATGCETFIVRLAAVELIAAITRRERAGSLTLVDAPTARAAFRRDLMVEYQAQAAHPRKIETQPANYHAAASGFLAVIDRMQWEVREYLSLHPAELTATA